MEPICRNIKRIDLNKPLAGQIPIADFYRVVTWYVEEEDDRIQHDLKDIITFTDKNSVLDYLTNLDTYFELSVKIEYP